jgi:hypothetical protein
VATKLGALNDYFSPGLEVTVPGSDGKQREYTVPLASAEVGLWCRAISTSGGNFGDLADKLPELKETTSLDRLLLGTAYAEMVRDGVPDEYVQFCTRTAYIWIIAGEEAAEAFWAAGGDAEKVRRPANREDRRAMERAGVTSTDAEIVIQSLDSSSGTRSRPRSGRGRRRR